MKGYPFPYSSFLACNQSTTMTPTTLQLASKESSSKVFSWPILATLFVFIITVTIGIYTGSVKLSQPVGAIQGSTDINYGSPRMLPSYPSYYPNYHTLKNDDGWQDYNNDDDDNSYNDDHTEFPTDYSTEVPTGDSTIVAKIDNVYGYESVQSDKMATTNEIGNRCIHKGCLLDIRFNKCPPIVEGSETNARRYAESRNYVNGVHKDVFPLLPSDYPIAAAKAILLKTETFADSVVTSDDYQVFRATPEEWMTLLKPPSYPSDDAIAPFWNELRHVIRAQIARRNGDDPATLSRWPDLWSDFDLEDIAKAVKGEYPASLQQQLIVQLFSQGEMEMDRNMTQFRSMVDFVGTQIRIAALNTWAIDAVAPITFMLKWAVGMPRPEEMAWLIASGQYEVNDGVPPDIIESLAGMNLNSATDFTAYEYVPLNRS
jgi:hypothetical protein